MNSEGFGSNGSAFEYVIPREGRYQTVRRIILLSAYALWVILFFTVGVLTRILLPCLALIPISVWILSFFTWRFSKKEWKLGFFTGKLTVTRQFDGKNKKEIVKVAMKDLKAVRPYTAKDKTLLTQSKQTLIATRNGAPEGAYLALWEGHALVFEANEKALKIIKYYAGADVFAR